MNEEPLPGMVRNSDLVTTAQQYLVCYRHYRCGDVDTVCRARFQLSEKDRQEAITHCLKYIIPKFGEGLTGQQKYGICVDEVALHDR
jgi:hypothetical protein